MPWNGKEGRTNKNKGIYRVVVLYFVVSVIWIFGSDLILNMMVEDKSSIMELSFIKGTVFVMFTTLLLYYLVSKEVNRAREVEIKEALVKKKEEIIRALTENLPKGSVLRYDRVGGSYCLDRSMAKHSIVQDPTVKFPVEKMMDEMLPEAFKGKHFRSEIGDGRSYFIIHGLPVKDDQGEVFSVLVVFEDVTELKRAEERLASKVEELGILLSVSRSLLSSNDMARMMSRACHVAAEGFGLDGVSIYTPSAAGGSFVEVAGSWGRDFSEDGGARLADIVREGPNVPELRAIKEMRDVGIEDIRPGTDAWTLEMMKRSIRSMLALPLYQDEMVIGSLNLYSSKPGHFTNEAIDTFHHLANIISLGIQKVQFIEEIKAQKAGLEEEVRKRTRDLQEANDQLESFAHSVAHELKAPVRGMKGFAEAVIEDYGDILPKKGREYLDRIIMDAKQLEEMVDDMLVYSRIGQKERSTMAVDLRPMLHDALEFLRPQIEATKAMVMLDVQDAVVMINRTVFRQIMVNLISNALKFTKKGQRPEVRIISKTMGKMVRISVIDNGIGVPQEDSARIFRLFERRYGQEDYPGTGIGLAIVAKGIERSGGAFGVISDGVSGSEFWVEIPLGNGGQKDDEHAMTTT